MLQYPVRFQAWGRLSWGKRQKQGSGDPILPGNPQRGDAWGILDGQVTVTLGQGEDSKGPERQQGGCWRANGRGSMSLWSILEGLAGLISGQQPQGPREQEQGSGYA